MGKPIERDFTQSKGIFLMRVRRVSFRRQWCQVPMQTERRLQRQGHRSQAMTNLAKGIFWKMLT